VEDTQTPPNKQSRAGEEKRASVAANACLHINNTLDVHEHPPIIQVDPRALEELAGMVAAKIRKEIKQTTPKDGVSQEDKKEEGDIGDPAQKGSENGKEKESKV